MATPTTTSALPLWNDTEIQVWAARALLQAVDFGWSSADPYACLRTHTRSVAFALGMDRKELRRLPGDEAAPWSALVDKLAERADEPPAAVGSVAPTVLDASLDQLRRHLDTGRVETALLKLSVVYHEHPAFHDAMQAIGDIAKGNITHALAAILGEKPSAIAYAMRSSGVLERTDLLTLQNWEGKLVIRSPDTLVEGLLTVPLDLGNVFADSFQAAGQAKHSIRDFDFLGRRLQAIRDVLAGAVRSCTHGINVLLHGQPGIGKTELALALGQSNRCSVYLIGSEYTSGDPKDREDRFRAYALAQRALRKSSRSLVIFDDCDDLFEESFGVVEKEAPLKAWVNRLLEANEVPTIWICNRLTGMDPAYLRRFVYTLEVPGPPVTVRRGLLAAALEGLPGASRVAVRAARTDSITPADIQRVSKVMGLLSQDVDGRERLERAVEVLRGRRGAPARREITPAPLDGATPPFEASLINTDLDTEAALRGIRRMGAGRFLFYGPPGTGKTAFAHHLSESADKELLVISASDWLSPFLGVTEESMRRDFDRTEESGAILFIDEADTFLRSREGAVRSWEVSQTNELLKRLEVFGGVVILATNFMEGIDTAVLRRLDVKARFDYLAPEQTAQMFRLTLGHLRGKPCRMPESPVDRLQGLRNLALGDFAAAARRMTLLELEVTAAGLLHALEQEVDAKPAARRRIGFV